VATPTDTENDWIGVSSLPFSLSLISDRNNNNKNMVMMMMMMNMKTGEIDFENFFDYFASLCCCWGNCGRA
jgi:hypothetical protein